MLHSGHEGMAHDARSLRCSPAEHRLDSPRLAIMSSVPARSTPHQEHALTERELRAAIDTAVDGMIVIDHAGVVVLYSAACERLFGHAAGEVLGRNVSLLMPSPDRENHDAYLQNYLKSGIARIIGIGRDVTGRRKDGSTFPMRLSIGELGRTHGGPLFVGTIHDLSEDHRARTRIEELQTDLIRVSRASALGTMGSALAHELNQPLSAVAGFVEASAALLDQSGVAVPDKLREFMDKAVTQTHRAGDVIRRLRELTRKSNTERSIEDINVLIEETCALATLGTRSENIDVRMRLSPDLPPVLVDRIQIQQIILNLVRNSIEALAECETRRILIATARLGDSIEITVTDTGPGLPASVRQRPFEPFVSTKPGGTGIGLSICRTIVEAHDGKIAFHTEAGKGTTFRVTVPVFEKTDD